MTESERDLWRLIEVTKAITGSLDLDEVLRLIVDAALSVLDADAALIILLDEHGRQVLRTERHIRDAGGKYSHTFTQRVLQTGDPVFVLDTDLGREVRSTSVQTLGLRTVVCAPLRAGGQLRGVLYAHATNPLRAFTEQKKQLFLSLCSHASVAINNAQLYQLRDLALANSEGVLMIERDRIQLCNQAARSLTQRADGELVGRGVFELFAAGDRQTVAAALASLDPRPREVRLVRPGAEPLLVEIAVTASSDARRVLLIRDISKQRHDQQRIIQTDRLAAIGTLAAGVAHEINNPLAYVSCNAELLLDWFASRRHQLAGDLLAEPCELAEQILHGSQRVAGIVKDLTSLARDQPGDRGPSDLAAVLESTLNIASLEIRRRARLIRDWTALPPVAANGARLGQVFLNLLVNAAQAIPAGNRDAHSIRVHAAVHGQVVRVEIEDTGEGIAEHIRDRIFDPFFTTKPIGEGTGLGLSICHGIIRSLGGAIEARPGATRGTCFVVDLPIAAPGRDVVAATTSPALATASLSRA